MLVSHSIKKEQNLPFGCGKISWNSSIGRDKYSKYWYCLCYKRNNRNRIFFFRIGQYFALETIYSMDSQGREKSFRLRQISVFYRVRITESLIYRDFRQSITKNIAKFVKESQIKIVRFSSWMEWGNPEFLHRQDR